MIFNIEIIESIKITLLHVCVEEGSVYIRTGPYIIINPSTI
jgi:hypothetical protein